MCVFSPQSHLTCEERDLRIERQCWHCDTGLPFLLMCWSGRSGGAQKCQHTRSPKPRNPAVGLGAGRWTMEGWEGKLKVGEGGRDGSRLRSIGGRRGSKARSLSHTTCPGPRLQPACAQKVKLCVCSQLETESFSASRKGQKKMTDVVDGKVRGWDAKITHHGAGSC